MTFAPIKSIVICGAGLASWMTAAALSKNLSASIEITVLETPNSDAADIFYGAVTSPSAYNFHLSLGLTEADLLMRTQSAFSYGTYYENWGLSKASWMQCFHNPLPSWNGVPFIHHISSNADELERYLVSAQAAAQAKFAHPPADSRIVLSSAEYGYHFKANDFTKLMKMIASKNGVVSIAQGIESIESHNGSIKRLMLSDGRALNADLYVDASGPDAQIISSLKKDGFHATRSLGLLYSQRQSKQLGPPMRKVSSGTFGWQSITPLQNSDLVMTIYDPQSEKDARKHHSTETAENYELSTGQRRKAWTGNCVALGHSAAIVEPVSPAPIMLLQMDIQRLMGLMPVTTNFGGEEKIFNDTFQTDVENIQLFNNAFFQIENLAETSYWSAARTGGSSAKLDRKLKQFSNRGLLVRYDLEPFNDEDWAILHYGMGRKPKRKDPFAALSNTSKIGQDLRNMSNSIQDIVAKMPPHHVYMAKFLNYLERNHVSEL